MTPEEMYQQYRAALALSDWDEVHRLNRVMLDAGYAEEGEALTAAILRAQDEHQQETWPRLRADLGELAAAGKTETALLLDRIFFGDPDIDEHLSADGAEVEG